nr:hypothetical protein [Microbacterium hydrocarbonoxydans]
MVDLRSRIHGAGATRGVNVVVVAYDARVVTEGDVALHHLDARVHPGDRRAPGETDLALVPAAAGGRWEHSAPYTADQLASIATAAGDNATELVDSRGEVVGRVYGVRADLLIDDGAVVVNTKTLSATELSVRPDAHGREILVQIEDSMRLARRTRDSVRAAGLDEPVLVQ